MTKGMIETTKLIYIVLAIIILGFALFAIKNFLTSMLK